MWVRLNKNVRVIRLWQTLRSSKIAVDCQILEERVPATQLQFAPEERALATGVHHKTRSGHARSTVSSVMHPTRPAVFKEHVYDLVAFADLHTVRSAIVQEQLV